MNLIFIYAPNGAKGKEKAMEKRDYIERILVDEKTIDEITTRIAGEIDEAGLTRWIRDNWLSA